ncbi:MAG: CRISPR-associated protein Csn1 [Bacteroidaceae bacterium]|nr:CRISPR-associated protein Csn1 [Bacteroidaceae bacterium]
MKQRILGVDTGTNSLGWAVVDRNEDATYTLIKKGDLIFQEGVKIEKGVESSKASERTGHKASRRHYFRRRLRKIETLKILIKYGFCPFLNDDELKLWHTKKMYPLNDEFMCWQRTSEGDGQNPYLCRHICLNETLDLSVQANRYLLGRALYHLVQRRGFLSNRLDNSEDSNDDGKVKTSIKGLSEEMRDAGFEYLGDYFYDLYSKYGNKVRIRNRYTDREQHYYKEFYAICAKQNLSEECIKELARAMYFQRPLKSQKQNIGKCVFEKSKYRCIDSHPDYEEFRMLSFINNIKIQTPRDCELRPLNDEERAKILPLFYRKSKANFDFEDIAKALAGKNNYAHIKDRSEKTYKFNYRMQQGVSGCPTTAFLMSIWGTEWKQALAETYLLVNGKNGVKSVDDIVTDVWNVLYSFSSQDKLRTFAIDKLQLAEHEAEQFSKAKITRNTTSLSLKAVRKILPYLRMKIDYTHSVFLANICGVVSSSVWNNEEQRAYILKNVFEIIHSFDPKDAKMHSTLEFCVKDFLQNNFELSPGAIDKLYHPSMIDVYPDAKPNKDGIYQLGSPRTGSIRNPMAMRSLHQLRHVVNQLLKDKVIDTQTEVHIEYARELNDANKRKAIADYQKSLETARKKYADDIVALYKEKTGKELTPTNRDIDKFVLWEEQKHICIYTGNEIGITDFLGENPIYDIEHTIPRSVGGDSTMMNLTLCENTYNRTVKRTLLPTQLANHEDILERIEGWKAKVVDLTKQIDKCRTNPSMDKSRKDQIIQKRHRLSLERDYWKGKYNRFIMESVPEGFSRRQGAGIGLISKYAGLYLKSLFHQPNDRNKSNVYVVKGVTTAEFRRMWGLQQGYEKKSRDNHVHHCIDAITIACIGKYEYDLMARYYHDEELHEYGEGNKPHFPKPWPTFTEDVLAIEKELLVVHSTPDVLPKQTKKWIQVKGERRLAQGDSVRGSLHRETYYGAIERDGELRFVVRKHINALTDSDINNIVDEVVKQKIKEAIEANGKNILKSGPIYMNEERGIQIKKVRVYCSNTLSPFAMGNKKQRDLSCKEYKQSYYVSNDGNYCLAIYEGESKGKIKRGFEVVKNIQAAEYYKKSTDKRDYLDLVPCAYKHSDSEVGYPLKYKLFIGTQVLLWEKSPEEIWKLTPEELKKRLYYVIGISDKKQYAYVTLRYHQEARRSSDLDEKKGTFKADNEHYPVMVMSHLQFNALIEGIDFELTLLGEVKSIKK